MLNENVLNLVQTGLTKIDQVNRNQNEISNNIQNLSSTIINNQEKNILIKDREGTNYDDSNIDTYEKPLFTYYFQLI